MSSFILKKCNQRVFDDVAHSVVVDVGVVIVHVLVRERLHDIHSKVYTLVEVVFLTPRSANFCAMERVISSSSSINLLLTASSL